MIENGSLLSLLQLADSALPIGRFAHSAGLEKWLTANPAAGDDDLAALTRSLVRSTATLDIVFMREAHATRDLEAYLRLDRELTAHKLTPGASTYSRRCGSQMASLTVSLVDDALLTEVRDSISTGTADGNIACVQGVVARAMGIDAESIATMELRATAAMVYSVAVRLGRTSPLRAQSALAAVHPEIEDAVARALTMDLAEVYTSMPVLDICAMAHPEMSTRFFLT